MTKTFNTTNKQSWRDFVLSHLNPKHTHTIVNEDGSLPYFWLEPVGTDAITFSHLISTNKISESNLIGIDRNPKSSETILESEVNIEKCRSLFPSAQFHCKLWDEYCLYHAPSNIGYIIQDLYDSSTDSKMLGNNLKATIQLANRCYENIGEVFVAINTDFSSAKRYGRSGSIKKFIKTVKDSFREESVNKDLQYINLTEEHIYRYKNSSNSSEMITCCLIFN